MQASSKWLDRDDPRTSPQVGRGRGQVAAAHREHSAGDVTALERGGRVERDQASVHHETDAATVLSLVEIVGGDENGRALAGESTNETPEVAARDWIHACGGLVEKQYRRPVQDGAAQGQTLSNATGERAGDCVALAFQIAQTQHLVGACREIRPGKPVGPAEELDVGPDRQVQVERELL